MNTIVVARREQLAIMTEGDTPNYPLILNRSDKMGVRQTIQDKEGKQ
jgi:hypothetical protein